MIAGSRRGTADTGWWIGGNRAYSATGEMLSPMRRYEDERPDRRPGAL
jgi:hypothetical protein